MKWLIKLWKWDTFDSPFWKTAIGFGILCVAFGVLGLTGLGQGAWVIAGLSALIALVITLVIGPES